jgi:hypothetical protein
MLSTVSLFIFGAAIGHLVPRFPVLFMSRGRGFNLHFPPHPDPVPLGPHLNQRVLHLRTFYWLSLVVVILPLGAGFASVKWGNSAFGFGLWLSAGWFLLNRMQSFMGGPSPPWTRFMAEQLQGVMNDSRGEAACCGWPTPVWGVTKVMCTTCGKKLLSMPRPDLGRRRTDGRVLGFARLLISDGYPIVSQKAEEE